MRGRRFHHILLAGLLCSSCHTITVSRKSMEFPQGAVLFTFDDGPNRHEDTTRRLLEVLRNHNIKACFALLGKNAEYNPDLVRLIHDEGHIIINHGYGDHFVISLGDEDFVLNLNRGEEVLSAALGRPLYPKYYRPQGGMYRKRQKTIWESRGYEMFPVSARAYDAVLKDSDRNRVIRRIVSAVDKQGGGIILLHDARDSHSLMETKLEQDPQGVFNRAWIPDVVEDLIQLLQTKGYRLDGFDWEPRH